MNPMMGYRRQNDATNRFENQAAQNPYSIYMSK
jgi:hypothetical protein